MLPQGAKIPLGTGTYGCTMSLPAPSEEGLCNPRLDATSLAECALQREERGCGPWRAGKALGTSACAPGKGAVGSRHGGSTPLHLLVAGTLQHCQHRVTALLC